MISLIVFMFFIKLKTKIIGRINPPAARLTGARITQLDTYWVGRYKIAHFAINRP